MAISLRIVKAKTKAATVIKKVAYSAYDVASKWKMHKIIGTKKPEFIKK